MRGEAEAQQQQTGTSPQAQRRPAGRSGWSTSWMVPRGGKRPGSPCEVSLARAGAMRDCREAPAAPLARRYSRRPGATRARGAGGTYALPAAGPLLVLRGEDKDPSSSAP
eukprot:CAMPEP_0185485282 /NCGR_PEP_ID=MMETSP1366-20130426/9964_1 /TAXON_ID=38817 /ORGANISM="Gephyrocapsa oceanica, Strain RCC1303" /LENGTH=109 /DNA_ID=CAMNT_0028093403 /DNA_START=166 /DNA_END=493 /DNA_ORIENTATION=+